MVTNLIKDDCSALLYWHATHPTSEHDKTMKSLSCLVVWETAFVWASSNFFSLSTGGGAQELFRSVVVV